MGRAVRRLRATREPRLAHNMLRVSALTLLVAMLPATASFSLGVAPATRRFVSASQSQAAVALRTTVTPMMVEAKEDGEDKENMMQQVKDAGVAGIISYVFWEWAFWGVSIPVCILEKLAGRAIRWVCGSVRRSRLYRGVVSCVARRPCLGARVNLINITNMQK